MSRTVRIGRATYLEEDKPGGGVTRTLLSGSADIIRPGETPSLVPGTARAPIARSASTYKRDAIELREKAPAAFTLRLDWRVRKDIGDELGFVRRRLDPDREAGGWLFAHRTAGDRAYEQDICRAVTAGTTGHGRSTLRLSNPIETWWATGTPHWRFCGDWHSHTYPDSTLPSEGDMRGWAGMLDRYHFARWLGVIVTRGESGWDYPRFTGWLVRREYPSLKLVCEPAQVVEV